MPATTVEGLHSLQMMFAAVKRAVNEVAIEAALIQAARETIIPAVSSPRASFFGAVGIGKRLAYRRKAAEAGIGGIRAHPRGRLVHLFERGTKPRVTKGGQSRGKMPAIPFVMRAYKQQRIQFIRRVGELLGRALGRVRVTRG